MVTSDSQAAVCVCVRDASPMLLCIHGILDVYVCVCDTVCACLCQQLMGQVLVARGPRTSPKINMYA